MSLNLKANVYLTEATEYIVSDGNLTWSVVRRVDFKTACHLPIWFNKESLSALQLIHHIRLTNNGKKYKALLLPNLFILPNFTPIQIVLIR
jgi:predicted FMN-binding regulatory protein PaiB